MCAVRWGLVACWVLYILISVKLAFDAGKFLKKPDDFLGAALIDQSDYRPDGEGLRQRALRFSRFGFVVLLLITLALQSLS